MNDPWTIDDLPSYYLSYEFSPPKKISVKINDPTFSKEGKEECKISLIMFKIGKILWTNISGEWEKVIVTWPKRKIIKVYDYEILNKTFLIPCFMELKPEYSKLYRNPC